MKYLKHSLLMAVVTLIFTACGGSTNQEIDNTPDDSDPIVTEKINCNIYEGTPKTDTSVTVKVICKNGVLPIESATVTLNHHTKYVEYEGANFIDYLGYSGLNENTNYTIQLEVIIAGETIHESINIRTLSTPPPVQPTRTSRA